MREPSRFQIWYGRDEPPVESRKLCAGPLEATLDGIDLRYVRFEGTEIVRRLFVAVRDEAWGTIPPRFSGLEVDEEADGFRVSFDAVHEAGELRFRWRGEYTGTSAGAVTCRMDGVAESPFRYNRIGFCVLHPRENAGRPYRARTLDGETAGDLPDAIGPQRLEDGKLWPLFPSYTRLEVEVDHGLLAEFAFEGDLFEMEDQRNWTDASFKTYSTPITHGWPREANPGQEFVQAVKVSCSGGKRRRPRREEGRAQIELGEPWRRLLPPLGLGMSSARTTLTERELELIEGLRVDHVRADLDLSGRWRETLEGAAELALSLGAGLELALFAGDDGGQELAELAEALALAQAGVARFLVLAPGDAVTDTRAVSLAREKLATAAPGVAFACGTNQWFTDLNRDRPEVDGADAVVYSICATVHAEDDVSVGETPAAQGDTVRSARAVFGGKPVFVSPVTFRPRFWPFGDLDGYRGLPYQVDPRQCALFGAAWTVASAKHLLEAGASSITYFETVGPRGVVESEAGSTDPEAFASRPGEVFPLYHVLADLGEWRQSVLVPSHSSEPLAVEALAVRTERGTHVLVCNLTPEVQRWTIRHSGRRVELRVLDDESARRAGEDPEGFRRERAASSVGKRGRFVGELRPYGVARIDLA